MTDRSRAVAHYQNAIQALSTDTYEGLSSEEREKLLRVLRDEQRRLLRRTAAASAVPPSADGSDDRPSSAQAPDHSSPSEGLDASVLPSYAPDDPRQ